MGTLQANSSPPLCKQVFQVTCIFKKKKRSVFTLFSKLPVKLTWRGRSFTDTVSMFETTAAATKMISWMFSAWQKQLRFPGVFI